MKLQRSAHRSVARLEADIMSFIYTHNEKPMPYGWAKSTDETLAPVRRLCLKFNRNFRLETSRRHRAGP